MEYENYLSWLICNKTIKLIFTFNVNIFNNPPIHAYFEIGFRRIMVHQENIDNRNNHNLKEVQLTNIPKILLG